MSIRKKISALKSVKKQKRRPIDHTGRKKGRKTIMRNNMVGYKLFKKELIELTNEFICEDEFNHSHYPNDYDNNGLCEQVEREYRQNADILYGRFVDRGLPVNIADAVYNRFCIL